MAALVGLLKDLGGAAGVQPVLPWNTMKSTRCVMSDSVVFLSERTRRHGADLMALKFGQSKRENGGDG